RLYTEADHLHLTVRDDGSGYAMGAAHDGVGLQNMRDRLGAVGGRIEISSHPGQGSSWPPQPRSATPQPPTRRPPHTTVNRRSARLARGPGPDCSKSVGLWLAGVVRLRSPLPSPPALSWSA